MFNQIKGALFGVAVGDALGAVTEFMSQDEVNANYGYLTEMTGGGWLGIEPGETTDDTAMTIAVAKGLLANPSDPVGRIGNEFKKWVETNPRDIGNIIRTTFDCYEGDWFKAAEKAHKVLSGRSAGNGSLMRCLPVALAYGDLKKIEEITVLQSKMTHYDDLASEACLIYNRIAYRVLKGESLKSSIEEEIKETRYCDAIKEYPDVSPNGYVVNTFIWVLNILWTSSSFEESVQKAANLGGDSDTIGAIAGGLAGLYRGFASIPKRYVEVLKPKDELETLSEKLWQVRENETASGSSESNYTTPGSKQY
ncbi:ADP-ribosylglycohydrolase family protein [Thermoactinomyces mirandus]|nr:ADP-ribosylglycohydrolase family protein [Thermoactinomyces mirandus]